MYRNAYGRGMQNQEYFWVTHQKEFYDLPLNFTFCLYEPHKLSPMAGVELLTNPHASKDKGGLVNLPNN